jgi:small GTP-binding protein
MLLETADNNLEIVRVTLYGKYNVGKSTLIQRLNNKTYEQTIGTAPTRGIDFVTLPGYMEVKAATTTGGFIYRVAKIRCTDTMGQERFRAIVRSYFVETQIALIVCAVNDLDSIQNDLPFYTKELYAASAVDERNGKRGKRIAAILNKMDLVDEPGPEKVNYMVNVKTFHELADVMRIPGFEVSAKMMTAKYLREKLESVIAEYFLQKELMITARIDVPTELYVSDIPPIVLPIVEQKKPCCKM